MSFTPSPYSAENKDVSELVVLYNITFRNGKGKNVETQAILQIGKNFSKFIGLTNLKRDSLVQAYSKKESLGAKELNELARLSVVYKKNILKDLLSKNIL